MSTQKPPPTIDVNEFIVQLEQLERLANILPIATGAASLGSIGGAVGVASDILTLTPFIVASGIGAGGVIALTSYLKHRRETLLSVLETLQSLHKVSEEEYLSFRQRLLLILAEGPGKPKEISKLERDGNGC